MIVVRARNNEAKITEFLVEDHHVRQTTICATHRSVLGCCWYLKNSGSRLRQQRSHLISSD